MKVIVIGLGSMGKRRVRLLKNRKDVSLIVGVDYSDERQNEAHEKLGIETYDSIETALNRNSFDCAFVCTAPLSHSSIINTCLKYKLHVFSEINLVSDGYEENIKLARDNNLTLFLSSTFLYRKETSYIKNRISQINNPIRYIYHIGQYLPDWHPWESLKSFFVSDRRTNGCREIMAIELPWIIDSFGEIGAIGSSHSTISSLNLSYDDNFVINIKHKNGNEGTIFVDVVSRMPVRNFELYSDQIYISWDGTPYGLKDYNLEEKKLKQISLYESVEHQNDYQSSIIENAYASEIEEFLSVIKNNQKQLYGFEKDLNVLRILDEIEGI